MTATHIYGKDLAAIHIDGFGFHWEQAAEPIYDILCRAGIKSGVVVDLGCGGGQWMKWLSGKGYELCGVDVSIPMIRAATKQVPQAQFITGSFADVVLPVCDAVTSLGEPINYLTSARDIRRTIRNVFAALRPGGIFLFDAREPAHVPIPPRVAARVDDTWACFAEIHENGTRDEILRKITTFKKSGQGYRRSYEQHRLKVVPQKQMLAWLRSAGFRARAYRGYGPYRFPPRQSAFVARKPQ